MQKSIEITAELAHDYIRARSTRVAAMPEPTIPAGSNRGEEDMDSWKAQQLGRELEAVQCCRVPEFLCRHFVKATKNLKSTELRCTITATINCNTP